MGKGIARATLLAALAVLLTASAVSAQPYGRLATLDEDGVPSSIFEPGDEFQLAGENFPPNTQIEVEFSQSPGVLLGFARTNNAGTFQATFEIPENAINGRAIVRAAGGGVADTVEMRIRGADAADDDDDDDGDGAADDAPRQEQSQEQNVNLPEGLGSRLPKTGTDTLQMAGAGAVLVLAGIALMLFTRRRRRGARRGAPPAGLLPPVSEAATVEIPDDLSSMPEAPVLSEDAAPVEEPHLVEADILALSR